MTGDANEIPIPFVSFSPPSHLGINTRTREHEPARSVWTIAGKTPGPYPFSTAAFESIGSIAGLDTVAEGSPWQDFEWLAAYIFMQNGFETRVGTVKTRNRQRRQYDVIAQKNGRTLLVECKQWSGGRYRLSALKQAVGKHVERAQFYESVTGVVALPVMVVLVEEEIRIFEGVPLVPVHLLDAFIAELDIGADGFSCAEEMPDGTAGEWGEDLARDMPGW